jgi:hypothetical protein
MAETSEGWKAPEGRPQSAGRHFMDSAQRKALSGLQAFGLAGRSQATIDPRCIAIVSHGEEPSSIRRYALAKENKAQAAPEKERGLLRRRLSRRRHENPETDGDSGSSEESALDLADIQGFISNHYCQGLAPGVRAWIGRQSHGCPLLQARLLPQLPHAITPQNPIRPARISAEKSGDWPAA